VEAAEAGVRHLDVAVAQFVDGDRGIAHARAQVAGCGRRGPDRRRPGVVGGVPYGAGGDEGGPEGMAFEFDAFGEEWIAVGQAGDGVGLPWRTLIPISSVPNIHEKPAVGTGISW